MTSFTRSTMTSAVESTAPFGTDRVNNDLVITEGGFVVRKTEEERFWAKVDKSGDCWLWTAYRDPEGYGRFKSADAMRAAHRVAWTLTHGEPAAGLYVCHRCDNPPCVRPDHLFLGTFADNMRDMKDKGRGWKWGSRRKAEETRWRRYRRRVRKGEGA